MVRKAQKVKKRTRMDEYRNEWPCARASEEKKQYTVRLETLALKKSSNNQVFEEISKDFEKLLFVWRVQGREQTRKKQAQRQAEKQSIGHKSSKAPY